MMDLLAKEGTIQKTDGGFLVRVRGKSYVKDLPGVECENPRAQEERRVYRKLFTKKRIYMAGEYDRAVQEILRGTDVIVLGMNGYSDLSPEKCALWGVRPGAYEQACIGILKMLHKTLNAKFKDIDIRFADGASAATGGGVDWAIIQAARDLNCQHLGHSCPKFMFYVLDDEDPVYVAETQVDYANAFIDSLDILVAANGRMQAFRHDIMAVFEKLKYLIPVNVLKSLSTNGGMPAMDSNGNIEDAVATYEQRVHLIGQRIIQSSADPYSDLVANICNEAVGIVRPLLSPVRAYGNIAS
ncbi:MAG: hypothetical protein IT342_23235 [Candidatus Melainabacteria bacterium]|nr:hypothetical protein [Candidatus Melainabacteria bacterium]